MSEKRRIPTRTCVICRDRRQKGDLVRIVRTPDGQVVFDSTGKLNGRGAYVCSDADHWDEQTYRGKLKHALKIEIDESVMSSIDKAIFSNQSEKTTGRKTQ